MTYDQYWYDDVFMIETFRKANEERIKQQNAFLHLQGAYFYDALVCALSNVFRGKGQSAKRYPDKPYDLFPEQKLETKGQIEKNEALVSKLYMENMLRVGQGWGKNKK